MPKSRKRSRRNRGSRSQHYVEVFSVSVTVGSSAKLTKSLLRSLPANHSWRIKRIVVEATNAYVPATTTLPGYYVPSAIQLGITQEAAKENSSRVVALGNTPRKVFVRSTSSYDWFTYDAPDFQWGVLNSICLGPTGGPDAFLRGVVSVTIELSREYLSPACLHHDFSLLSLTEQPSSSSSNVEFEVFD